MQIKQKNVVILGATGSIGNSTLSVIEQNPEHFSVLALVAGQNVEKMLVQCCQFTPRYAVMADADAAKQLKIACQTHQLKTEVLSGMQAMCDIAAHEDADIVVAAILGAAGLSPTLAAIEQGKTILLANKESLVTCGRIFMQAVAKHGATLLPIDSEHNAIFQSLPEILQQQLGVAALNDHGVTQIVLTGSGGPFREMPVEQLKSVTPEQACAHPNWSMGKKISVDSATMMNKGLEYIEARWLFNASAAEMELIIHPQSIIHSMVRYADGSVIAQLGNPDMRTPIAHALSYPNRIVSGVPPLDFLTMKALTFSAPDFARYPCLKLAIDAFAMGQAATTVLNAANEVAVEAFLQRKIRFTEIAKVNALAIERVQVAEPICVKSVIEIDDLARQVARQLVNK